MAIFILLHPLSLEPQGLQNSVIDSLQTEDLVRAYVFSKIKDAQEFCNAAKNLLEFMVNVPKGKEQLYHQEFLELTIKNKEYELIVYEAMPEEEREAG